MKRWTTPAQTKPVLVPRPRSALWISLSHRSTVFTRGTVISRVCYQIGVKFKDWPNQIDRTTESAHFRELQEPTVTSRPAQRKEVLWEYYDTCETELIPATAWRVGFDIIEMCVYMSVLTQLLDNLYAHIFYMIVTVWCAVVICEGRLTSHNRPGIMSCL
jgi:hypothetical protein